MHSLDQSMPNVLETFTSWERCFNVREAVSWFEDEVDAEAVKQAILQDGRFLPLSFSGWGTEYFLPVRTALQWWSGFNVRLVQIGVSRLHERHLADAMNSLYRFPLWAKPPQPLMEIGLQSGWVAPAWDPGFYVFPIAHLMHQVTLPVLRPTARMQLAILFPEPAVDTAHLSVVEAVEALLTLVDSKLAHIIRLREALAPCGKATLEELGTTFGVSRERIRQLEKKFWRTLRYPRHSESLRLMLRSLVNLVSKPGGLILSADEDDASYVRFSAKCLGIPFVHAVNGSLVVLGTEGQGLEAQIERRGLAIARDNVEPVAALLDSGPLCCLDRTATLTVAQAIVDEDEKKLTKQAKVYLALKQIGSSAHYSKVARVYWQLFPDDETSERYVHAILSNCAAPDVERYGIVWIGARGTYGLKEQGYWRPALPLFQAVTKIVEEKFASTQRAVHINVIASELGGLRNQLDGTSCTSHRH